MINSSLLKEAEVEIIKMVQLQAKTFAAEIKSLRPRDCNSDGKSGILKGLKWNSKIPQLDPFLHEDGVQIEAES